MDFLIFIVIILAVALWARLIWISFPDSNTRWHYAYKSGHLNHSHNRHLWPMCPTCGSESSKTITEKGYVGFFGKWHTRKD